MPKARKKAVALIDRVGATSEFDLDIEREVLNAILGPVVASWPPGWAGLGKHPLSSLDDAFDLFDDVFPDWSFGVLTNCSAVDKSGVELPLYVIRFFHGRECAKGEARSKQAAIVAAALNIREKFPLDTIQPLPIQVGPVYQYDHEKDG